MARRKLAAIETKPEVAPVETSRKADPLAWAKAMELADGHVRRLRVLSPTEILVLRPKG